MSDKRSKATADEREQPTASKSPLGQYLSQVRDIKKLTLREVEEATGKQVSNAYLSQLEKGKIAKPSPNVLHALANVYNVAWDTLMEKAGYVVAAGGSEVLRSGKGAAKATQNALAKEELSDEEEGKLLEYLAFLRRGKSRR